MLPKRFAPATNENPASSLTKQPPPSQCWYTESGLLAAQRATRGAQPRHRRRPLGRGGGPTPPHPAQPSKMRVWGWEIRLSECQIRTRRSIFIKVCGFQINKNIFKSLSFLFGRFGLLGGQTDPWECQIRTRQHCLLIKGVLKALLRKRFLWHRCTSSDRRANIGTRHRCGTTWQIHATPYSLNRWFRKQFAATHYCVRSKQCQYSCRPSR